MLAAVDYDTLQPNDVALKDDRHLQRAVGAWHPKFRQWRQDFGPRQYQDKDVYLGTAIAVDRDGRSVFDYVKMPAYRWGIFLAEPDTESR